MSESRTRRLRVAGTASEPRPATWGQLDMWREIQDARDPAHGNLVGGGFLPPDCTVDRLLHELGQVLHQYESVRTVFRHRTAGGLTQRLVASTDLPVEWYDLDGAAGEVVGQWFAELEAEPFELDTGPLFRFRIGVTGGRPVLLMFGGSHLACDFLGARVLFDDLLRRLDGRPPLSPVGAQPMAWSAWERSESGTRVLRRSLNYWTRVTADGPASALGNESGNGSPCGEDPAECPRYRRGGIRSRAVVRALDRLAAHHRASTSHLLLSVMAGLLGRFTGRELLRIRVVAANRGRPELRNMVGTLCQEVVTAVPVVDGPFSEQVRATSSAFLVAMRHAQYDPDEVARIVTESGVDLDLYFNDMWTATRDGKGSPAAALRDRSGELPDGGDGYERTSFDWENHLELADVGFFLEAFEVYEDPAAVHLSLLTDSTRIPSPLLRTFLFAIEESLEWLADDPTGATALRDVRLRHDPGPVAGTR